MARINCRWQERTRRALDARSNRAEGRRESDSGKVGGLAGREGGRLFGVIAFTRVGPVGGKPRGEDAHRKELLAVIGRHQ